MKRIAFIDDNSGKPIKGPPMRERGEYREWNDDMIKKLEKFYAVDSYYDLERKYGRLVEVCRQKGNYPVIVTHIPVSFNPALAMWIESLEVKRKSEFWIYEKGLDLIGRLVKDFPRTRIIVRTKLGNGMVSKKELTDLGINEKYILRRTGLDFHEELEKLRECIDEN